ncbi:MAG: hypothetical protein ABI318_14915 [Chthoniobacteraceae bacterium]
MKLPTLLLAILFAVVSARAEVSPIRMTVELSNKSTTKPKEIHDKTQTRSLKITLDNNSTQAFDGLAVKYWFVGHTEGTHGEKVLKEGERKSSLAPRGKDVVESEVASSHFIEEHYPPSKGGKGGAAKKIPASGDKMTAYAVRVMQGDKVLAEYYSEPSVKDLIKEGGQSAPATAPKPGKKP